MVSSERSPLIAEVVFNLPLERSFHYLIPSHLSGSLQPGMRVIVPFGSRELLGYVTRVVPSSPIRQLKTIRRLIDPVPVIARERWALATWLSGYYCCSLGEALATMVPTTLRFRDDPPAQLPVVTENSPQAVREPMLPLSPDQQRAFHTIERALHASNARTILLHGVTGSGKTELYLQAIARVLDQGCSAICLISEIALTPQTIDRFRARFGEEVVVWHSRLTQKQRAMTWRHLTEGRCHIVVGARSAVFAPVQRLGMVILDEEHETTYKQEDTPRYHARDVAMARARLAGATVLLGSATPSIESYYLARQRRTLISLPERIKGRALPKVDIIDLREEFHR